MTCAPLSFYNRYYANREDVDNISKCVMQTCTEICTAYIFDYRDWNNSYRNRPTFNAKATADFSMAAKLSRQRAREGELQVSKRCILSPNYAADEEKTAAYSNRLEVDLVLILQ
jgi:hypothetical protein